MGTESLDIQTNTLNPSNFFNRINYFNVTSWPSFSDILFTNIEIIRGEFFTEFQKIAFWKSFLVLMPLGRVSPHCCPWETLPNWDR
jgi:hypothetical protein